MIKMNNLKKILTGTTLAVVIAYAGAVTAADNNMFAKSATDDSAKIQAPVAASGRSNRSLIRLTDAQKPGLTDPLADAAGQIAELDKLTPIVESLEQAITAHNVINRLRGYRDNLKAYNDMVRLHNKSIEVLKQSEQCTIGYIGRYFADPVKVWSGMDLRNHPQDHELRSGLSAWAVNSFEVAKSAQLAPMSVDDANSIGVVSIDDNLTKKKTDDEIVAEHGQKRMEDAGAHENKQKEMADIAKSRDGVFFKEPSKQDEYEKDSRKANLLAKDIGSEASLMLAENPEKWGTVKKKFPVWNDQKSFYSQYLDGKYANIAKFIKDAEITSSSKAKISAALLEDQRKFMSQAEYDVNPAALAAIAKTNAQYDSDYAELLKKYNIDIKSVGSEAEKEINNIDKKYEADVDVANKKLASLYAERDAYAKDIGDININNQALINSINVNNQDISNLESELGTAGVTEADKQRFNTQKQTLQQLIDEMNQDIVAQNTKKAELEKKYDELSNLINNEQSNIAKLDNKHVIDVREAKERSAATLVVTDESFIKKHNLLIKTRDNKITKINQASIAAKAALQTNSSITVQDIVNTTRLIIGISKDDAIKNIELTRQAFDGIGDDLYRGNKHSVVLGYHQALVKSLQGEDAVFMNLKLEGVAGKVRSITTDLTGIVSGTDLDNSLSEMFVNLKSKYIKDTNIILKVKLFDDLLKNVNSSTDSQYFVGATPKLEDYRAPMIMPDYNLPPFREYVRFDSVDLENVVKDSTMMEVGHTEEVKFAGKVIGTKFISEGTRALVDKNKFLTYGSRIPDIWKLMLKDKAFVESDFYLDETLAPEDKKIHQNVLRLGGENGGLYRGGIYPCVMNNIKIQNSSEVCNIDQGIEKGTGVVDVIVNPSGSEFGVGLGFVRGDKRSSLLQQSLPTCMEASSSCQKIKPPLSKPIEVPYMGFNNGDVDNINPSVGSANDGTFSELGTLLSISSGKANGKIVQGILTLSPGMQSIRNYAVRIIEANKNQQNTSMKGPDKQKDDIYSRALMIDNQIGDFLNKAENEQAYRRALEELKTSIDTMQKELLDTLKSIGFVPTADFDISNDKDFNLAKNKVNTVKTGYVKIAKQGVDSIEAFNSELLSDSKKAYGKVVVALETDKEAVTPMSTNVYDSFSLDEEVKSGEANQKVDAAYQKNADKSIEEQLKAFETAYCSAY